MMRELIKQSRTNPLPQYANFKSSAEVKYSEDLAQMDLQRVSEATVLAAKNKMNEAFEKNLVTSDHPSFQYDKRVNFVSENAEPSDWDD